MVTVSYRQSELLKRYEAQYFDRKAVLAKLTEIKEKYEGEKRLFPRKLKRKLLMVLKWLRKIFSVVLLHGRSKAIGQIEPGSLFTNFL